jgi:hypothetical protein
MITSGSSIVNVFHVSAAATPLSTASRLAMPQPGNTSGLVCHGPDVDWHRRDDGDQARQRKRDRMAERLSSDLDER